MSVLTVEEAREAYRAGLARSQAGRARSGQHRYGWNPDPAVQRKIDGESAVAELLVAKTLGRRWLSDGLTPDDPDAGDVEGGLQVRWTERRHGCLIVHDEDPDGLICVLVVGNAPEQRICGWILTLEAKTQVFWRENVRHPAYFVPQQALLPLSMLEAR